MDIPQTLEEKETYFRKQFEMMDNGMIQSDPNPVIPEKVVQEEKSESRVVKTKAEAVPEVKAATKTEDLNKPEEISEEKSEVKGEFEKPKIIQSKNQISKEKDKDRFDRSWKKFEQDKEAFKKEKADFEVQLKSYKEQIERQVREEYKKKRPDVVNISPDTYLQMAEEARANGDYDKADEFRAQAYKLKEELKTFQEEEAKFEQISKENEAKIATHRQKIVEQIQEEYPEIVKLDSPIRKHLDQVYQDKELASFFNNHPNGYWYAAHVADLAQRAETASALDEELKTLKAELKELQKKSSPATSFDNGGINKKSVNQMTLEEKSNYYRMKAEDADRYAGVL